MAAHRLWRLDFTARSEWVTLTEIEMRGVPGGPDLTSPSGTVTASVDQGRAPRAFDNIISSSNYWSAAVSSAWITYDFGTPVDIAELSLRCVGWPAEFPKTVAVSVADEPDSGFFVKRLLPWDLGPGTGDPAVLVSVPAAELVVPAVLAATACRVAVAATGTPTMTVRRPAHARVVARTPMAGRPVTIAVSGKPVRIAAGGSHAVDAPPRGLGLIRGTVELAGTPNKPLRRLVRLYRDADGRLIGETWSAAADGAYAFAQLDERGTYTVLAYDNTGAFRAVVADRVAPEPMAERMT